jgi:mannose-6-phosphate isomerase-like protein (cupin superfamily)
VRSDGSRVGSTSYKPHATSQLLASEAIWVWTPAIAAGAAAMLWRCRPPTPPRLCENTIVANEEQLRLLRRGVDAWNQWRQANPGVTPDLGGADLSGADLAAANLAAAVLTRANLASANLRRANLRGADLDGADISGADLQTAGDLTEEQLNSTHGDQHTILPEGLARPERWPGIRKVNLAEAFASFSDYWRPRVAGDINNMQVKVVKVLGEFIWHRHEAEDELFLVVKGRLLMRFRDREVSIGEGEFLIVPRGVEHQPVAVQECEIVLIEPRTTLNTGNVRNERTVAEPERI